jgi:hypothetical protein
MTVRQMWAEFRYLSEATIARSTLCANSFFARGHDTKSAIAGLCCLTFLQFAGAQAFV